MVQPLSFAVCALVASLLVLGALVPATAGSAAFEPAVQPDPENVSPDLNCIPLGVPLEDTHLEATDVEADNLSMESTTVTSEDDPGSPEDNTFDIETERIEVDEVCMGEPVDVEEWGTVIELRGAEITNSTIDAPNTVIEFVSGRADTMTIYSPLPLNEVVAPILQGGGGAQSAGGGGEAAESADEDTQSVDGGSDDADESDDDGSDDADESGDDGSGDTDESDDEVSDDTDESGDEGSDDADESDETTPDDGGNESEDESNDTSETNDSRVDAESDNGGEPDEAPTDTDAADSG